MTMTSLHSALRLVATMSALWPLRASAQGRHFVVDSAWVPLRIERPKGGVAGADDQGPNVLHCRNRKTLVVQLFDLTFLGQLPRPHRAPFLILGARGCHSCDIETQVYVVPADTQSFDAQHGGWYYPGSLRPAEPTDTTPFYRGRMFVGRCLADAQPVVVWFQQERDSTGHWVQGVYRLRVVGDSVHGEFLGEHPPLGATVRAARTGTCREVPGIDQTQG